MNVPDAQRSTLRPMTGGGNPEITGFAFRGVAVGELRDSVFLGRTRRP